MCLLAHFHIQINCFDLMFFYMLPNMFEFYEWHLLAKDTPLWRVIFPVSLARSAVHLLIEK